MSELHEDNQEQGLPATSNDQQPTQNHPPDQPEALHDEVPATEAPSAEQTTDRAEAEEEASEDESIEEDEESEAAEDQPAPAQLPTPYSQSHYTLDEYLAEWRQFSSIAEHKNAIKRCIARQGIEFKVRIRTEEGTEERFMMTKDILEALKGIKLVYEPKREFETISAELEQVGELPAMRPEDFVARFDNVQEGNHINLEEFQIIQYNESNRVKTKKHYITFSNLDALCTQHHFVSPLQKDQVKQALKAAGWKDGKFNAVSVWRHD